MKKLFRKKEDKRETISRIEEMVNTPTPKEKLSELLNEYHRIDSILNDLDDNASISIKSHMAEMPHWGFDIHGITLEEKRCFLRIIRDYYKTQRDKIFNECVKYCKEYE